MLKVPPVLVDARVEVPQYDQIVDLQMLHLNLVEVALLDRYQNGV